MSRETRLHRRRVCRFFISFAALEAKLSLESLKNRAFAPSCIEQHVKTLGARRRTCACTRAWVAVCSSARGRRNVQRANERGALQRTLSAVRTVWQSAVCLDEASSSSVCTPRESTAGEKMSTCASVEAPWVKKSMRVERMGYVRPSHRSRAADAGEGEVVDTELRAVDEGDPLRRAGQQRPSALEP